jgi:tetratricopeptide (TPR) repeat protein
MKWKIDRNLLPSAPMNGMARRLVAMAALASAPSRAAPPPTTVNPLIEHAQKQMDNADFEAAVQTLNQAVADPDNTTEALAVIYRMLGNCYLYMDDGPKARAAFERLLEVQPDYELPPSAPPKLRDLYKRIKDDIRRGRVKPVRLVHERLTAVPPDRPVEISAQIIDLPLGARARVYYRRAGTESYSSVDLKRKLHTDTFSATLPGFELPPGGSGMEYYLEVTDAAQRRIAGAGDALEPTSFQVAREEQPPPESKPAEESVLSKPTLWAIVGGVVLVGLAAGGATYLIVNQQHTGTLTVTVKAQ